MILSLPRSLVVLTAATALTAGAVGAAAAAPARRELLSVTPVGALSRDPVVGLLDPAGIDLGLGTGAGTHPYLDLPSTVTASLDLLRAADEFSDRLDRRVRVTGFSQGGPAAMALAEEPQRRGRLVAVAGISGLYDLFEVPGVAELFDGHHGGDEIAAALPNTPHDLLTDGGVRVRRTRPGWCGTRPTAPVPAGRPVSPSGCSRPPAAMNWCRSATRPTAGTRSRRVASTCR